jgi:uncharacterized phage-associated protein
LLCCKGSEHNMPQMDKILYFQYIVHKLFEWNFEVKNSPKNDLNILKTQKLLFFTVAGSTTERGNILLDNIFNNFVAMPYGHVESDIYNYIKTSQGKLDYFDISNKDTNPTSKNINELISSLRSEYIFEIDESIQFLKKTNNSLIDLLPFDLVELSHLWYSWQKNYKLAQADNKKSLPIPIDDIKSESKIFSLQIF